MLLAAHCMGERLRRFYILLFCFVLILGSIWFISPFMTEKIEIVLW
jgi:hypothetical protein